MLSKNNKVNKILSLNSVLSLAVLSLLIFSGCGKKINLSPYEQGIFNSYIGNLPIALISTAFKGTTKDSFPVTITFSEPTEYFSENDILIENGKVSNLTTNNNIEYSAMITPLSAGEIKISVNSNFATGPNGSTSSTLTVSYDPNAPDAPSAIESKAFHSPLNINLSGVSSADFKEFRYTLTGIAPNNCSSGTPAQSSTNISITATTILNAIACDNSGNASPVMSRTYTYYPGWTLEATTSGINETITISLTNPNNLLISWGDSKADDTLNWSGTSTIVHTYDGPGTYTFYINGTVDYIGFNQVDTQTRLTKIISPVLGISGINSFDSTFENVTSLTSVIPKNMFDETPLVTTFRETFYNSSIVGPIPNGLFDNNPLVTNMYGTFRNTSNLTGTIPADIFRVMALT